MKLNKRTLLMTVVIAVLIIIAYICRMINSVELGTNAFRAVRTVIYIGLFVAWGVSVSSRIMQVQVRRYLIAIAGLMLFWFSVRTFKFYFVSPAFGPDLARYLWYLYYLPMLFIPLMSLFVAMSLGKPEHAHLSKLSMLFYIPTVFLFLLALTNDSHQLFFTFPSNAGVWTDENNGYGVGYYAAVIWMIVCALMTLGFMWVKCRVSCSRRRIWLPLIPICILLVYMALYYTKAQWLRVIAGDMTALTCLLYIATLETCIQCGLIQSNTHYMELFDASTVGAQITDEKYNVVLSSKKARTIPMKILHKTEEGPVMLDGGIRVSGAPIRGGHVIWSDDVSALSAVLEELKETKENLEDSNDILEEENALKVREAQIAEQDRLYNIIQNDTARQISLMDEMTESFEKAETEENRVKILGKMLVIGTYLKRRSNLIFFAAKTSKLPAQECVLTFGESLDNLELYGVYCGFRSELTGDVQTAHLMAMYDFFEEIVERSLDSMTVLTLYIGKENTELFITINTDASADFYDLASKNITAVRDDDGEWKLRMRLCSGGDI